MTAGIAGIHYLEPGIDGIIQTQENAIFIGDNRFWNFFKLQQRLINGASRDTGNTGLTTELRVGLAMALDSVTNKWQPWVAGDVGGTNLENVKGFLFAAIQTQKDGANQDRFVSAIAFGGHIRAEGVILLGETAPGIAGKTDEAAFRTSVAASMSLVRLSDEASQDP